MVWSTDEVLEFLRRNTAASVAVALLGFPLACFALPVLAPLALAYYFLSQPQKPLAVPQEKAKGLVVDTDKSEEKKDLAAVKPVAEKKPSPSVAASAVVEGGSAPPLTGGVALLRKMREQKAARAKAENPDKKILVAFASQTGTAQEIAKALHAQIVEKTGTPKLAVLSAFNDVDVDSLKPDTFPVVAFVAASTGDGDPPDNTASFYAKMLRKKKEELKGVRYTCLGLGDSNYTRFMAVPRNMRKKFEGLGAECIYWNAEADEVDGLEETVEKWTEGALEAVLKVYRAATAGGSEAMASVEAAESKPPPKFKGLPALLPRRVTFSWQESVDEGGQAIGVVLGGHHNAEGSYTQERPFLAKVKAARRVTPEGYGKQIVHMELSIDGSNIEYKPGDAFGVLPVNDPNLVDDLLQRLGADGSRVFEASEAVNSIRAPCSVRAALSRHCDLTTPAKKSLIRLLAESCDDVKEKDDLLLICSAEGKPRYKKEILEAQPNLLDLLRAYPSCRPKVEDLVEFLPALAPREYSVSSCPHAHGGSIHFAFSVVEFETGGGRTRRGVATNWLAGIADAVASGESCEVPIFPKPSKDFHHPEDAVRPVVMIGPGTGVSPFRGFVHHRKYLLSLQGGEGAVGESWLFFGCRERTKDAIYLDEFDAFVESGVLTTLDCAFSREQEEKVYVQDKMGESGTRLSNLILNEDAFIFVCGDGQHMAKDVHAKLEEILCEHGGLKRAAATAYLQIMQKQGRYVRDIWS